MGEGFKGAIVSCAVLFALFFICVSDTFACSGPAPVRSISIDVQRVFLNNSITGITISDVVGLLRKGFPSASVSLNNPDAGVHIAVSISGGKKGPVTDRFARGRDYDYLQYPDHEYHWASSRKAGHIVLALTSPSFQGVSFGLYGLLQEKLGFKFYHPRRTIVPVHKQWPLPADFQWNAFPRFDKKGFHLHSLHPIELAEQLNNPDYPDAAGDLREYIDWLARNRQNVLQFYLLRGIDRSRWITHAGELAAYAHKRGILAGVEFSLFMVQQKAFQSINLFRLIPSYKRQIDSTLSWIFRVKWDYITVDFSMGEYMPDLASLMPELKAYLIRQANERYKTRVMVPTHVINEGSGCQLGPQAPGMRVSAIQRNGSGGGDMRAGILIHTVMFYSLQDAHAPVYGDANLQCMLARAIRENKCRETWYWPEAAYWVSFDNSVPLLLLPYLEARWTDMKTIKKAGIDNHLTFSSGWEWGYWLVDWSIARWSWSYTGNGPLHQETFSGPLGVLHDLFPDARIYRLFQRALYIQNYFLKGRGMIAFLSALDPSAELSWPFNRPFQPRPFFSSSWLLYQATDAEAKQIAESTASELEKYATDMNEVVDGLEREIRLNYAGGKGISPELSLIACELTRSLKVTSLRAQHRALTIRALLAQRKGHWWQPATHEAELLLQQAARLRQEALVAVRLQEQIYRYPVSLIARQRKNFTAYHFGYLYPASELFFWRREEEQVRHRRFDAFYMDIWDFGRICGLKD
ncbi:MAG: hypothetical protein HQL09_02565 [Nitrospirae bacterium]|nr:hypothetical protein [Nitrospirota bacterium]